MSKVTMYLLRMAASKAIFSFFNSPIGTIYVVASSAGLKEVSFTRPQGFREGENQILRQARQQLERYFKGEPLSFRVPLDLNGTPFQKRVWSELARIPYGETRSYKDIAEKLHMPGAARAVGSANGKNPVCVIIPCHRVIAADGSLGGYSAGIKKKAVLLRLEQGGCYR